METPKFEYVLDGVVVSLEANDLTYKQALEMMLKAYPERRVDIYKGLREVVSSKRVSLDSTKASDWWTSFDDGQELPTYGVEMQPDF